jgi:hypothetical protein
MSVIIVDNGSASLVFTESIKTISSGKNRIYGSVKITKISIINE